MGLWTANDGFNCSHTKAISCYIISIYVFILSTHSIYSICSIKSI